tara:strand:+ start:495531 stop:495704 length:174 start_codon:yes stop_codon:yes gene_type:complete
MEQERVTLIIIITTIVVLVFTIAMVTLFAIFQQEKNKLLVANKGLRDLVNDETSLDI